MFLKEYLVEMMFWICWIGKVEGFEEVMMVQIWFNVYGLSWFEWFGECDMLNDRFMNMLRDLFFVRWNLWFQGFWRGRVLLNFGDEVDLGGRVDWIFEEERFMLSEG